MRLVGGMVMSRASTRAKPVQQPSTAAAPLAARALADLDTQLMLQAAAGDRDAANNLVRRNADRIARYIRRIVGRQRPVEDLTQDVFLRALSHAASYEPSAKVSTWLYRIATNVSLNYLKQSTNRRPAPAPPDGELEPADQNQPTPDRQMNLDEVKRQVAAAIGALPVNQRVALTLFQYESLSYEQIAAVLETTVEAVRSLLMRARTTLRRELRGVV